MTVLFQTLWTNHPYPGDPCDRKTFENQCAIRMGVCLENSGVSTASFRGAKCYPGLGHNPKHILRAQELADWLTLQTVHVGDRTVYASATAEDFRGKNGIVFVKNGWGSTDHIDVWDGGLFQLKGGDPSYFALGEAIWFWELS